MKKNLPALAVVGGVFVLLCGCGNSSAGPDKMQGEKEMVPEEQIWYMESEPVLDYEIPDIKPGILVSRQGYASYKEKRVVFLGCRIPEEYKIIEKETKEVVYEGKIKSPVYNEEIGEYTGYGDFSSLQTEGDYYIECDYLGSSYLFSIDSDYYENAMEESVRKLLSLSAAEEEREKPSEEEMIQICRTICTLLLAGELFPDVQADGIAEAANGVWDILEYAAAQAAFLEKWQNEGKESPGMAAGWYAAAMAKLSFAYQKQDEAQAAHFLQMAEKAWNDMESREEDFAEQERFFAAAELYRKTGKSKYHKVVKELGKNLEMDIYDEPLVLGALAYVSTGRAVNNTLCNSYLSDMLKQAEKISGNAAKNVFWVSTSPEAENAERFFAETTIMAVVDYIITNEEYGSLVEDCHHYLLGRNEKGINYFNFEKCGETAENSFAENPVYLAKYIMIVSEIRNRG